MFRYLARAVFLLLLLICVPILGCNYVVMWLLFRSRHHSKETRKVPPTIPFFVPFLGSSLDIGFNAFCFIESAIRAGNRAPFRVSVPNTKLYFVQGAKNVALLWKRSGTATSGTPLSLYCLKNLFGMPLEAIQTYALDNSGHNVEPFPESHVAPHNRVDHRTHVGMLKFTNETGLKGFFERWAFGFRLRLQALNVGEAWTEVADFTDFFDDHFASAVIESITGPHLFRLNPNFARDFTRFDHLHPGLLKGLPQWMIPETYVVRGKLVSYIKKWHAFAKDQFQVSSIESDGDADPYWGSLFIRDRNGRQGIFSNIDNFDEGACASSDLAFLWGATTNLVPSTMWCVLETFKDPSVLSRIRTEVQECLGTQISMMENFDIHILHKLQSLPLLQSVYAEAIRLHNRGFIARYIDREEVQLSEWLIPKGSTVVVSNTSAHMDESFWNTRNGVHPLDTFWADRFLIYPKDPLSGPIKHSVQHPTSLDLADDTAPKFSLSGTGGSWLPYGGGPRACIGRTFAKRAIISTIAMMVTAFDIEFLASEEAFQMDPKTYGFGQRPVGKLPFRVRTRYIGG